jgi:putative transposase
VIKAFLADGSELGNLCATGRWGITPHDLRTRKAINKLKNNRLIHFTQYDDPIRVYQDYLEKEAQKNKTKRNKLASIKKEQKNKEERYQKARYKEGEEPKIMGAWITFLIHLLFSTNWELNHLRNKLISEF